MIEKIWLRCIRNLNNIYLAADSHLNPHFGIYGRNNQGKTNILEGIYFAINGSCVDQSGLTTFIQNGQKGAYTQLKFSKKKGDYIISGSLDDKTKKSLFINKKRYRSFKDIQPYLIAQYISVDTIRIFKDSSEARRKDLDRFCCFYDKTYTHNLSQYERALKQRNRLIKQQCASQDLQVWDQLCVDVAPKIVQFRINMIQQLVQKMNTLLTQVPVEDLTSIEGAYEYQSLNPESFDEYSDVYKQALKDRTPKDMQIGFTTIGPQRDDIHLKIQNQWIVRFSSRGINQITAILWKLAQVQLLVEKHNTHHVVLLDDALAEVDQDRAKKVMNVLTQHAQVIFTTAQKERKDLLPDAKWYEVIKGDLFPITSTTGH